MATSDSAFGGSIPALYDRCLGPLLFDPYAKDLASRLAREHPVDILETAAGTGIVTAAMAGSLPDARIVATDLNQAMLDVAAARLPGLRVQVLNAQDLPFDNESFDAVVCQFGVMFFPDRIRAYREVLRVLRPGGAFLFNAWDSLAANPVPAITERTVAEMFPEDPPGFLGRTPYGYFEIGRIEKDLRDAGFASIAIETETFRSKAKDPRDAAAGFCMGSPLRVEIEQRDPTRLEEAVEATTRALVSLVGDDGLDAPMAAHVVRANA